VSAQTYSWDPLRGNGNTNGSNGRVYAITVFQNNIVIAGGFTLAGGVSARNIAVWNGVTWDSLGSGLGSSGDTVYSLAVYNNQLYAGGSFENSGENSLNNIAVWNGSSWNNPGGNQQNINGTVYALTVFENELIAGGSFSRIGSLEVDGIASWDGNNWSALAGGLSGPNPQALALAVYGSNLIVAGKFNSPGINIASWNGNAWSQLGTGIGQGNSEKVLALTSIGTSLYAGGKFTVAGGNSAINIAQWNGSSWSALSGGSIDDQVSALASYNSQLIIGGNFHFTGSVYSSRVAQWNGTSWARMVTGMQNNVNAFCIKDTSLYAGGSFIYAGGSNINSVAKWYNQPSSTISGSVTYSDNNQPVPTGIIKAFVLDSYTREIIVVDSTTITNGAFTLHHCPHDTLRVIGFPNDELDYVPTYYPSSIDWTGAATVYPGSNLNNINIVVYRVTPAVPPSGAAIGGHIYLNISISGNPPGSYPYQSGSILYIKQGSIFRGSAVSGSDESYTTASLFPGTYDLYVYRLGYISAYEQVVLGNTNLDTVNFYLDSLNLIGIRTISQNVPKSFVLGQNYPNPFNPVTKIRFDVALPFNRPLSGGDAEGVRLVIYDILGREVAILINQQLNPGTYEVEWNAGNFPSGVYFYTLSIGNLSQSKKMILLK